MPRDVKATLNSLVPGRLAAGAALALPSGLALAPALALPPGSDAEAAGCEAAGCEAAVCAEGLGLAPAAHAPKSRVPAPSRLTRRRRRLRRIFVLPFSSEWSHGLLLHQ